MVLRNNQSGTVLQLPNPLSDDSSRGGRVKPALTVSFCSQGALDILGLNRTESIINKDIFKVLSEKSESPSMNKMFRTAVRDNMAKGGETLRIKLVVGSGPTAEGPKKAGGRGGGTDSLVSYWTPMKDAVGTVEWVVLVLAPLAG